MSCNEAAMRANAELKAAVADYAKARPVFEGYKAAKYSRKYLAEHEADIAAYREYRETKKAMQEIVTVKSNIDHLLGLTDARKNKEMER